MTRAILLLLAITIATLTLLAVWRLADRHADDALWTRLSSHQPVNPARFELSMIAGLPEPAQRYFRFAIKPGTPLSTVAAISMRGYFSLGSRHEPNYLPMRAEQILAPPFGFLWKLRAGGALMRVSGSDAAEDFNSWSRFWLLGVVPVARAGNNIDHYRSAFGRYVAEAVFWTPAALLPGDHVRWDPVDDATARVTLSFGEFEQSVDLFVAVDGSLSKVVFPRWSDANATKTFQRQPFGGSLSEYVEFDGFRLPTRIEAGNFFGTDEYFPFYKVEVTSIRLPNANNGRRN